MESSRSSLVLLLLSAFCVSMAVAGDPDILSDFVIPLGSPNGTVDGTFFTLTSFRSLYTTPFPENFTVTKAAAKEFPAVIGQSVSMAVLQFPANATNPPHTHPRSAELLFLVEGTLEVGFVDTTNTLYTQKLQSGDIFVFPKGLVHFQYNADPLNVAVAISGFGSANAGTVSIPVTVFGTGIDDAILAKSFKTDNATVEALKGDLTPPPSH